MTIWAMPASKDNVAINPLTSLSDYLKNPQNPAPVGIGAYGFYYDHRVLQPIVITSHKVFAVAKINSLSAYNPNLNRHQHGANLQFNVMMEVKTTDGTSIIWLQNTARFDTDTMEVNTPHNNIWNVSTPHSNIIAYGLGTSSEQPPPYNQIIYAYQGPVQKYSLPLTLKLGIEIQTVSKGVMVYFYNEPFGGGTFDKVLLPFQNIISANLLVAPSHIKSNGVSMDSELIWGGYCCGYEGIFNSMDSYLEMFYENSTGKLAPFPALFTFGTETAETAYNLQVLHYRSGGHVVIGTNDNHFLEQLQSLTPAPVDNDFIQLRQQLEVTKNQMSESQQNNSPSASIPSWVRNNAGWWSKGSLSDADFVKGIQYLVQQGIIQIPQTQPSSSSGSQQIPQWVKNTAGWWANGQVSDDEFVKAVQYMISSGIMTIQ